MGLRSKASHESLVEAGVMVAVVGESAGSVLLGFFFSFYCHTHDIGRFPG